MSKAAISTPKYFGSSGTVRSSNIVRDRVKKLTDAISNGRRVDEQREERAEQADDEDRTRNALVPSRAR